MCKWHLYVIPINMAAKQHTATPFSQIEKRTSELPCYDYLNEGTSFTPQSVTSFHPRTDWQNQEGHTVNYTGQYNLPQIYSPQFTPIYSPQGKTVTQRNVP